MGGPDGMPLARSAASNVGLRGGTWRRTIVLLDASLLSHAVVCKRNLAACCTWLVNDDASGLIESFLRMVRSCAAWASRLVVLFEGVMESGAGDDAGPRAPPSRVSRSGARGS